MPALQIYSWLRKKTRDILAGFGEVQNLSKSSTFLLFYLFGDPIFVAQAAWELVDSSSPLASDSRVARPLLV